MACGRVDIAGLEMARPRPLSRALRMIAAISTVDVRYGPRAATSIPSPVGPRRGPSGRSQGVGAPPAIVHPNQRGSRAIRCRGRGRLPARRHGDALHGVQTSNRPVVRPLQSIACTGCRQAVAAARRSPPSTARLKNSPHRLTPGGALVLFPQELLAFTRRHREDTNSDTPNEFAVGFHFQRCERVPILLLVSLPTR